MANSENFLKRGEKPLIFYRGNANFFIAKTIAGESGFRRFSPMTQRAPEAPRTIIFKEVLSHV